MSMAIILLAPALARRSWLAAKRGEWRGGNIFHFSSRFPLRAEKVPSTILQPHSTILWVHATGAWPHSITGGGHAMTARVPSAAAWLPSLVAGVPSTAEGGQPAVAWGQSAVARRQSIVIRRLSVIARGSKPAFCPKSAPKRRFPSLSQFLRINRKNNKQTTTHQRP